MTNTRVFDKLSTSNLIVRNNLVSKDELGFAEIFASEVKRYYDLDIPDNDSNQVLAVNLKIDLLEGIVTDLSGENIDPTTINTETFFSNYIYDINWTPNRILPTLETDLFGQNYGGSGPMRIRLKSSNETAQNIYIGVEPPVGIIGGIYRASVAVECQIVAVSPILQDMTGFTITEIDGPSVFDPPPIMIL